MPHRGAALRASVVPCLLSIAVLLALAGPAAAQASDNGKLDPFGSPGSSIAASIQKLWDIILPISIVIGVLVEALLLYGIWRYRAKRAGRVEDSGEHERGHHKLEIAWTLPPAIILLAVGLLSTGTLASIDGPANTAGFGDFTVKVVASQWNWHFVYPDNSSSDGILQVEQGKNVKLDVVAQDVIHDLAIPNLGVKIDAIPGRTNHAWFNVEKAGDYQVQCMEYCAGAHAYMRGTLRVLPAGSTEQGWKNPLAVGGLIRNCAEDKNATKALTVNLLESGGNPWSADPSRLTASAGDALCIEVKSPQANSAPHNLTIEDAQRGKVAAWEPTLGGGQQGAIADLKLKAGSYTYFCAVPGHRQLGMQGTLTVS